MTSHERALRVYEAGFVTSIHSLDDFKRAIEDCHCALLEAPDDNQRRNISRIQNTLHRVVKGWLWPTVHCAACKAETQSVWHDVCNVLEKHLKPELWELIGEKTRTLFDSITEPPRQEA